MEDAQGRKTGLASLFLNFAKIGLFTFGGGYAMLSLIERTCVEQKKWITHDEMLELTVIAESTPGPIAVNSATFIGYRQHGFPGALCATLGVVLPSFAIIFLISAFLNDFLSIRWVASAFKGIKIAVGLLITDAGIRLFTKLPKKALPICLFAAVFAAMLLIDIFALRFSTVSLLLIAAAVSAAAYGVQTLRQKKKGAEE